MFSPHHVPVTPIKVLCIESEAYLADLLRYALSRDGFTVELASTGADALRSARTDPPDVAVLDLDAADIDGYALCAPLRQGGQTRVILLGGSGRDADMVAGFRQGADDYVCKPFSVQVLSCRIRAVARRGSFEPSDQERLHYRLGPATFDAERHEVAAGAASVKLTPIQGRILRVLLENAGHVVSADQLMAKVWRYDAESEVSVVKTHISNLRRKLSMALGAEQIIHTVAGLGYSVRQDAVPPDRVMVHPMLARPSRPMMQVDKSGAPPAR